jgi:hypothetical protein
MQYTIYIHFKINLIFFKTMFQTIKTSTQYFNIIAILFYLRMRYMYIEINQTN